MEQTNLKKVVDNKGLKYRWVADKAKVDRDRFYRILGGAEPTRDEMKRISKVLGVEVMDLFFTKRAS